MWDEDIVVIVVFFTTVIVICVPLVRGLVRRWDRKSIDPASSGRSGVARVRCTVKNVSLLAGEEVVQLYVRDVLASVARPVMELKGFQRVRLAPGEAREVTIELPVESLRMLDRDLRWVVEPGVFRIMVGSSSKDIRLRGELTVQ